MAQIDRIALPTRIQGALEFVPHMGCWRLWLHTSDFIYGTYLELNADGSCDRITERVDEGPDIAVIKPASTRKEP